MTVAVTVDELVRVSVTVMVELRGIVRRDCDED